MTGIMAKGTPVFDGEGFDGCNSASFELMGELTVPSHLSLWTDGYAAKLYTTITGDGMLSEEMRTLCFMNKEMGFDDVAVGFNGMYCHAVKAGFLDYSYGG